MPKFKTLGLHKEGCIARVNFNRPEMANSLNETMWDELRSVFQELDQAPDIRVVVLGGAGKHFSTGIDFGYLGAIQQEIARLPEDHRHVRLLEIISDLQESVMAIARCRKPVLAIIQGYCMGGGVDIVAACDMRFAMASTQFSVKEVDLAIVADLGSLQRLPGIVGEGMARELAMTGRIFGGAEAKTIGFANDVFPSAEALESGVMAVAATLSEKSPLTVRGIKESMNYSRDHGIAKGLDQVARRNAKMLLSIDLEEAFTALMEKRPPRYSD